MKDPFCIYFDALKHWNQIVELSIYGEQVLMSEGMNTCAFRF